MPDKQPAAPVEARTGAPTPPPAAPPPSGTPVRRRRVPWVRIAGGTALVVIGLLAGFFIGRAQFSGDTAALADANARVGELQSALIRSEDRNWTYYRTVEGLKSQAQPSPTGATATSSPAAGAPDSYSDGVYLVGEGIPAGQYSGVVTGAVGYWARLQDVDGSTSAIIENALPRGPFVLTIQSGDRAVELRGVTLTAR